MAKLATERLLLFASMLDQIASSSCADLLVVVDMDASLGLALFDGEYLESPKFVRDMVDHLPRLKTIIEALLEVVIAGESNKSMAFMKASYDLGFKLRQVSLLVNWMCSWLMSPTTKRCSNGSFDARGMRVDFPTKKHSLSL